MMVMYGGTEVESGETPSIFQHMAHPYTRGLFGARPRLGAPRGVRLKTIPGTVPELLDLPLGCTFAGRCAWADPVCATQRPQPSSLGKSHQASCLKLDSLPPWELL
jgi:peptide/nickel transport system ATP-binding protein